MKRVFALAVCAVLLFSSASADGITIPKFSNHLIKYNTLAKGVGAPELKESSAVDQDGMKWFYLSNLIILFELDSGEEIKTIGIRTLSSNYDTDVFLKTCACAINLLSGMDFDAYGSLLYQYIQTTTGQKEALPGIVGDDTFRMSVLDDGSLMFIFNNNDRKYWF